MRRFRFYFVVADISLLLLIAAVVLSGQSTIRPGTISAPAPNLYAGSTLPGGCAVGAIFFDTSASLGANLYGCTAPGVWTAQAGGGGSSLHYADQETPSGTIDGSNAGFSLAHSPNPQGGLILTRNGLVQQQGIDYSLSFNAVTFLLDTPQPGDVLMAWYRF